MDTTEKYPIDFDGLKKGSVIQTDELEKIFEVKTKYRLFSQKALDLCRLTQRELKARGVNAAVRMVKDNMVVLDSALADQYTDKAADRDIKHYFQMCKLNMDAVDLSELTIAERDKCEDRRMKRAILAHSIKEGQKKIRDKQKMIDDVTGGKKKKKKDDEDDITPVPAS